MKLLFTNDGLQPRQPGEHPYRAADADGKEQREGGVMADRVGAFAEWRKGVISDDNLKQVLNDLQTVVDVLYAMDDRGATMHGFRLQLESARSMYQARQRDRRAG